MTAKEHTEKRIEQMLNDKGAFFAFSQSQFDEQKKEGVTYVRLGLGLLCPKENSVNIIDEVEEIYAQGRKADIEENGLEAIIIRELSNYEAWYTHDPTEAIEALSCYEGISSDLVQKVFNDNLSKYAY